MACASRSAAFASVCKRERKIGVKELNLLIKYAKRPQKLLINDKFFYCYHLNYLSLILVYLHPNSRRLFVVPLQVHLLLFRHMLGSILLKVNEKIKQHDKNVNQFQVFSNVPKNRYVLIHSLNLSFVLTYQPVGKFPRQQTENISYFPDSLFNFTKKNIFV